MLIGQRSRYQLLGWATTVGLYYRTMMNLMHGGSQQNPHYQRPAGEILQDLGGVGVSIVAAVILLPAIGLRALSHRVFRSSREAERGAAIWCPGCRECNGR